MKLGPAQRR